MDSCEPATTEPLARHWMFRLLLLLALCGLMSSIVRAAEPNGNSLTTQMTSEQLQRFFDKTRWSILRSQLNKHTFKRDKTPLAKPVTNYPAAIRLSHRNIYNSPDYEKRRFQKPLHFLQSHFYVSPLWTLAILEEEGNFSSSIFEEPVAYNWVIFNKPLFFSYGLFKKDVVFYGAYFNDFTDFYRTQFKENTSFNTARFKDKAVFSSAQFYASASFSHARFDGTSDFSEATFFQKADFSHVVFNGPVDWRGTTFAQALNLNSSEFNAPVFFNQATMPDYLDLSNVTKIKGIIDLTHVKKAIGNGRCKLNLIGSDINKIRFRSNEFVLTFPEGTPAADVKFVYESVLTMLENNGFDASYRDTMIAYKQYQYALDGRVATNLLQKHGWDYGFDPERIFTWIFMILLLFTSINAIFYRQLVEKVMDVAFLKRHASSAFIERHFILRYIFYFPMTFVFTLLIFFSPLLGFRRDFTAFKSPKLWVNIYIVSLICVGVTCSLFIFNYLLGGR